MSERSRLVKLVRDRVGKFVGDGRVHYATVPTEQVPTLLRAKLLEEAGEYLANPCIGELADLLAVLRGLARHDLGEAWTDVEREDYAKTRERGDFTDGVGMFTTTTAPTRHEGEHAPPPKSEEEGMTRSEKVTLAKAAMNDWWEDLARPGSISPSQAEAMGYETRDFISSTDHEQVLARAEKAAELEGFKKGLAKRDEQIRTGTLPEGIGPVPPDSVLEGLAGELDARADEYEQGDETTTPENALRGAASLLRDCVGGERMSGWKEPLTGMDGQVTVRAVQELRDRIEAIESDPQTPEDTKPRCPTCGSDDPAICQWQPGPDHRGGMRHPHGAHDTVPTSYCCPDPWHGPDLEPEEGAGR